MREAVVVLPPDVRAEEVVERRDRAPPRDLPRHLQPLRVLVEHRVDDVDERLVAVEEAVPARQQVALEPALAQVLGQDLHHSAVGARPSSVGFGLRSQVRPVASKTAPSRFEAVSSGPKSRKLSGLLRDHVAQERAEHPRRLARRSCRARAPRPRSRGSRAGRARGAGRPRSRAGSRSSGDRPSAEGRRARRSACRSRRRAPPARSSASIPRGRGDARGCRARR